MKKLALFLVAALLLTVALASCGKKCHSCNSTENLEKYGSHYYCFTCVLTGKADAEDLKAAVGNALDDLGNQIGDAVDEYGPQLEDALNQAGNELGNALGEAGDALSGLFGGSN